MWWVNRNQIQLRSRAGKRRDMSDIGIPELLIILAILIVLFGPARIANVGKSLGEALRSFRHEVRDDAQTAAESHEKQM